MCRASFRRIFTSAKGAGLCKRRRLKGDSERILPSVRATHPGVGQRARKARTGATDCVGASSCGTCPSPGKEAKVLSTKTAV